MAELLVGVVALAIIEVGCLVVGQRNLDVAEAAILDGVGGVVAEDVVVGDGLLRLHNAAVKVVVIEQRLAACVAGQGVQRVLRLLEVGADGAARLRPVYIARVALRALRGVAQRRLGDEPAGIDGPEG